jgi:hypothetical protein
MWRLMILLLCFFYIVNGYSQEEITGVIIKSDTVQPSIQPLTDTLNRNSQPLLRTVNGSFYSFTYGGQLTNFNSLNEALRVNNYPEFSKTSATFGLAINKVINCWIVGSEAHMVVAKEVTGPTHEASLNSWYGFINIGYRIIATQSLMLYPLIGFGGATSTLRIGSRITEALSFDQVLADPNRSLEITTGSVLFNSSLNLNVFTKSTETGGFQFGISGGYIFSLPAGNWYTFNTDIGGGPSYNLSGPYARIKFGYAIFK